MTTVTQSPAPPRIGTVSYSLTIIQSARRVARKLGLDGDVLARNAVNAYRASGNPHDGKRVIFAGTSVCAGQGGAR